MLDRFFRLGQPFYDSDSFDKPNHHVEDPDDCSELYAKVSMNDLLVCLKSDDDSEDTRAIASQASLIEVEFKKNNIKSVK